MVQAASQPELRLVRMRPFRISAAALLETMMAMAIVVIFLSGQYAASSRVWSLLRASVESNAASRVIYGRSEQIRASTWDQVTDPTFLSGTVLAATPDTNGDLGSLVETVNVSAWPIPSPNPPAIRITRNDSTGTVSIVGAGDGTMSLQSSIRIDITAAWVAKGGQPRTKQISMLLSEGGVTGRH